MDQLIAPIPDVLSLYKHQPWPHNQLGVCLDENIVFNTAKAADDEVYSVMYQFGEASYFEFTFISYPKDQHDRLRKDLSRKTGLLSIFASSAFNFGGHSGRLFVSDHAYSPSASNFRWYATDAKAGSTRNPFISIEGSVDLNDFPEYKDLRNIDADKILIAILSSLRPRENGLVGTK
ncbi:hypothetical protein [Pelagibaculum spongiae]|uniref:Uncharacterized protein n=1 Tax=Pelagibaculum spongiae TaxID=2080658 RepID=A0A2V1GY25_9GAMM|nr:hypothetical protein [Pelagibaculum spongiae]PVZ72021.1 hypothetical protein DC094_03095 [Pelagibaculum spongiae]